MITKKPYKFKYSFNPDVEGDNYYNYNIDCRFEINLKEFFKEEQIF